ncbi:MAG: Uma2 family endonuclease [Janthinobacterium lividum]
MEHSENYASQQLYCYGLTQMAAVKLMGPNAGWNLPDGSTLSSDANWIDKSRTAGFTAYETEHYLPLCPDFIIKVRSQSDSLELLQAKMETWLSNGAKLAWMLDPYAATLTIYRPASEPEVLLRPDSVEVRNRWPASA